MGPVSLSICLSICLFVYLSLHPSLHLSLYRSIYLPTHTRLLVQSWLVAEAAQRGQQWWTWTAHEEVGSAAGTTTAQLSVPISMRPNGLAYVH